MSKETTTSGPQAAPQSTPQSAPHGIVSVNSRGGTSSSFLGKVIFLGALVAVLSAGGLVVFNKIRDAGKAKKLASEAAQKSETSQGSAAQRRVFDKDTPPPIPIGTLDLGTPSSATCPDGKVGTVMTGTDGKALTAQGQPMRVCGDGQVLVPAVQPEAGSAPPIPISDLRQVRKSAISPGQASGQVGSGGQSQKPAQKQSRYAGDALLSGGGSLMRANFVPGQNVSAGEGAQNSSGAMDPLMVLAMAQSLSKSQPNSSQGPEGSLSERGSQSGSIGSMLKSSETPRVAASMIGDRNMILPKGRTIECGLSMKLVSDVAGMASCVLTQNVYSDNGRVVLLERGSEAVGEYRASMEQGQRRLFVIWSRIKTPHGVVISLDSPGADGLGTTGLSGSVDSHWWQRVGSAFLLSTVQDAIAYSASSNANSAGSAVVLQNTQETGNRMAEKVLDSTINIKPTLYKNQGDRGSIYVARDLDFGTVYDLRAR